uniref:Ig-like domain-containing protein n=1 Tax=Stegastes partitus TaxID=144197 RepID=A0A3B4ZVE0_9TELE
MQVKEDDDAILNCFLGTGNIKEEVFDWKKDKDKNKKEVFLYAKGSYYGHGQTGQDSHFVGRVFHFPDQLQFGNASIVIRKTKTSDSGTYTCHFPNHQPEIRSSISLTVGASSQPIITLHKTNNGVLLKCVVRGASPKPVVEWWDSDGNILPADQPKITERGGNKYDVILNATVTKTGFYRCVSTQKEINHQIETETHVIVPGEFLLNIFY